MCIHGVQWTSVRGRPLWPRDSLTGMGDGASPVSRVVYVFENEYYTSAVRYEEKLRELETSFVEISHEVVETDKVAQNVTAKRK